MTLGIEDDNEVILNCRGIEDGVSDLLFNKFHYWSVCETPQQATKEY